jgi:hypothetical protein
MGRVVAIETTGSGDVTRTHERWRAAFGVGYSSPLYHGGRLYVVDNSANLHALDANTGQEIWSFNLGTVGKGSPVWADGKIYVTEVNGRFHILRPGADGPESLDVEQVRTATGRPEEIYGSPAVAYGRIYFTTEEGLYCLGDASAPFRPEDSEMSKLAEAPPPAEAEVAKVLVTPAEKTMGPAESASFRVQAFDAQGRALGQTEGRWSLENLYGKVTGGRFVPDPAQPYQAGRVVAHVGELQAGARVRVLADLPLKEDFEAYEPGSRPVYLLGAPMRFVVEERDGNQVLAKGPSPRKLHRHHTLVGPPSLSGYTVQADIVGTRTGRRVPDMGLVNSGYTLDLLGGHQQIEVRSWASALRMAQQVDFSWQPEVWYTMKFRVDVESDKAVLRGKVWPAGEQEPEAWTITAEDPLPIRQGSPGLYGYSPTPIYYDNLKVTRNP